MIYIKCSFILLHLGYKKVKTAGNLLRWIFKTATKAIGAKPSARPL
jgi:hypothetical protein